MLTLIVLEVVLGIDNLVFIAILAENFLHNNVLQSMCHWSVTCLNHASWIAFCNLWLNESSTQPLITVLIWTFSGRDLILLFGGLSRL